MVNRLKMLAGVAGLGLLVSACQPGVVYDQAGQGAAIGAAVGCVGVLALDPQLANSNAEDCLRGAVVGGLLGGAIGAYLDEQQALLSRELVGTGVKVIRHSENELRVVLPSEVSFASGSSSLTSGARSALNSIASSLVRYPQTIVHIDGHTDSVGSASSNLRLSIDRASNVESYLARQGVNAGRLIARGFGETQPQASNATASGRAENRRVELRIVGR